MNYHNHYYRLIQRAKEREITTYSESHHIIPRCIGGTDEKENLVKLTGREHFIAHLLLSKMYPEENGLILAIHMMTVNSNSHLNERINNRMYSWLKEKHAKVMSKQQFGENNSQFGTMWIFNIKLKESKKIKKDEFYTWEQDGWLKGRRLNFDKLDKKIKRYCVTCKNIIENKNKKFCCEECKPLKIKLSRCEINSRIKFARMNSKITKEELSNLIKNGKNKSENIDKSNQRGEYNSQFGKKFMFNIEYNIEKRVEKINFDEYIKLGWEFGQLPIFCEHCNCKLTKMTKTRHKCKI